MVEFTYFFLLFHLSSTLNPCCHVSSTLGGRCIAWAVTESSFSTYTPHIYKSVGSGICSTCHVGVSTAPSKLPANCICLAPIKSIMANALPSFSIFELNSPLKFVLCYLCLFKALIRYLCLFKTLIRYLCLFKALIRYSICL